MSHESRIELRDKSYELRLRPQAANVIRRVSDLASGGHAEAPGSDVVRLYNFRQATKLV
jgi:hypothetical protein